MKQFLKVFSIAFLCFMLAVGAGIFTYVKFYNVSGNDDNYMDDSDNPKVGSQDQEDEDPKKDDPLQNAIEKSKRLNILLLGMEGTRSDTMILVSFDPRTKSVDMISIPRDTYYHRKGYDRDDQKKINAVYGNNGIKGTMNVVEDLLEIPVDHYVKVTYKGVAGIIDALGGVEVDVPPGMKYDDIYDNPPLHIDIPEGRQVLKGEKGVEFLRFRKSNDGTISDGDIGRIKRQQEFMKSAVRKALSFRLPAVLNATFSYVKTDLDLNSALVMVANANGIKSENITMTTLPGRSENGKGPSYFYHDPKEVRKLMLKLYNVEVTEEETGN